MKRGIKYFKLLFALKMGDFFYFLFNLSLSGLPICQVTDRNPGYRYVTQVMASFLICPKVTDFEALILRLLYGPVKFFEGPVLVP